MNSSNIEALLVGLENNLFSVCEEKKEVTLTEHTLV